jgi:hypothetical protein
MKKNLEIVGMTSMSDFDKLGNTYIVRDFAVVISWAIHHIPHFPILGIVILEN